MCALCGDLSYVGMDFNWTLKAWEISHSLIVSMSEVIEPFQVLFVQPNM